MADPAATVRNTEAREPEVNEQEVYEVREAQSRRTLQIHLSLSLSWRPRRPGSGARWMECKGGMESTAPSVLNTGHSCCAPHTPAPKPA